MKATILDSRSDDRGTCHLAKITLEEYINALPPTYQEYDIQREIVSNVYLDRLVETVLSQRHIPPIVLIVDSKNLYQQEGGVNIETFKIIDGLQRTYRLQAIRRTIDFCIAKLDSNADYLTWNKFKFSREFSAALREINSNTDILRALLSFKTEKGEEALLETFSNNHQWFEIWVGLSETEEVRLMLTLNAGHKPVKTRHQLELLFLNLLPVLRSGEGSGFQLVREKDISTTQFSKSRECGSFHFAHIVTALLSLYEGKPVVPTTGLIQAIQSSETGIEEYGEFTSPEFLKHFVAFLVKLDRILTEQYPEVGVLWMGREVSLAGLFGAISSYATQRDEKVEVVMRRFLDLIASNQEVLNLSQFEHERNSLDLSKVNIGNVNRVAVFGAVKEILESSIPTRIDWRKHFGTEGK